MTAPAQQQPAAAAAAVETLPILGRPNVIHAGFHLTAHLARDLCALVGRTASKLVVVTDNNVAALHLDALTAALAAAWAEAAAAGTPLAAANPAAAAHDWLLTFVLPPGEAAKTRTTKAVVEDWMLRHGCTRDTVVVAFGGGVVGDMIGYVAATYMRGCSVVQVPTTLLAMVDSSIGGKTAVDVPAGKNLIGAFHQPLRVYIDPAYLATLPEREIRNGMAEVVKTAAFASESDFALLEADPERVLRAMAAAVSDPLVLQVIFGSARVKAQVVSADEKEGGLRGLLNFGHTVGHAFEAALTPRILHGECVSIGMVYEAEMARLLGHLSQADLGRLVRCIAAYGLPTSIHDPLVKKYLGGTPGHVAVDRLLDYMKVDKKNSGANKRLVLLSKIGATVEPRASVVADDVISLVVSPGVHVHAAPAAAAATAPSSAAPVVVKVPGSKSISNRALLLAALAHGTTTVRNLLHSDDTQVMLTALQRLGACTYSWDGDVLVVNGHGGAMRAVAGDPIYLGNAGTAARFLTCAASLAVGGPTTLTGNARMQQRPIRPLVDALAANGVQIECSATGCLPVTLQPGFPGGHVKLAASVSSQYVSAILLCAPYAKNPVTLELTGGKIISQPYIEMTIAMMKSFGIHVQRQSPTTFLIPQGVYAAPGEYVVEPDASSATYPLAVAAITGRAVTVPHMGSASLQGDANFAPAILAPMGCTVTQTADATTVVGPAPGQLRALGTVDMESLTDAFLTASVLAAVAAAPNAQGTSATRIDGIANQRVKECNRIRAMMDELAKYGVRTEEHDDGLIIYGQPLAEIAQRLANAPIPSVHCYDDHRVAMSFSVLGTVLGARIEERKCVEKTWPAWWDTLGTVLGVSVSGYDVVPHAPAAKPAAATNAAAAAAKSVVLIGMRGAGKTTLGRALARDLGRTFVDVDEEFVRRRNGQSIADFVASSADGWTAFRREEAAVLRDLAAAHPTGAVIACGGGIVEDAATRELLASRTLGLPIVHIRRRMDLVFRELAASSRPSLGETSEAVWKRREPWYAACADVEFYARDENGAYDWKTVEAQLAAVVRALEVPAESRRAAILRAVTAAERKAAATASPVTSFVSLTLPTITTVHRHVVQRATEGADAVELRADLLQPCTVEAVAAAFATLRTLVPGLPVVFTVRTVSQAGAWPDADVDGAVALLEAAIRWGAEIVDVETTLPMPVLKRLQDQAAARGVLTLTSYHDAKGAFPWSDHVHWGAQLYRAAAYGDIVKLVGRAHRAGDNAALTAFRETLARDLLGDRVPLIAINMGAAGQPSRVFNDTLTPVTHAHLAAAAPGQMSLASIHAALAACGVLAPSKFYLFGAPIDKSKSPLMHNTGFTTLGLPYTYALHPAAEVTPALRALVRDDLAFGGASVTIPLKEVVHTLVDDVAPAARAVGAINTLWRRAADGKIVGDNTDVDGIRAGLVKRLHSASIGATATALVLGAGGTARAAVYALLSLPTGHRPARIVVANRSADRAARLVADFAEHARGVELVAEPLDGALQVTAAEIVVSTLPRDAQEAGAQTLATAAFTKSARVVVELVYGAPTPVVRAVHAVNPTVPVVTGAEVLVEQGLVQFERWTGLRAPRRVVEDAVYAAFAAEH
ncbi:3-dehydroquinate dehydratase (3-dehydroquinase) [Blastocladiella emersonii ATCC 22665]|nr:3-dehydroquinate dehydratase (3-dehydroquinase) [Blastocladiella emersonii ATCC 22665]